MNTFTFIQNCLSTKLTTSSTDGKKEKSFLLKKERTRTLSPQILMKTSGLPTVLDLQQEE